MPSTWPFCPGTPIHSSELAESTGRGPHGREHRRRQQTLGAQAPGPGGRAQGQRLQQPAQRRHVGWRPRSRLRVPGPGWRGLPSTKLGVHSQAAMADILSSETGLGPATKGVAGPVGEGGLGGVGISRVLQESSRSGDPQVCTRPACSPKAVTRLPSLTCGRSTAEHRAWPQCEVGETAEGVLGAPSDKELRGLSAPSRASVAPGAAPPPRLSSPLAHHGRHNIVHKLISLGNGLQAGKRPTLGRPAAARQTPAGDVPLPPTAARDSTQRGDAGWGLAGSGVACGRQPGGSGHVLA